MDESATRKDPHSKKARSARAILNWEVFRLTIYHVNTGQTSPDWVINADFPEREKVIFLSYLVTEVG